MQSINGGIEGGGGGYDILSRMRLYRSALIALLIVILTGCVSAGPPVGTPQSTTLPAAAVSPSPAVELVLNPPGEATPAPQTGDDPAGAQPSPTPDTRLKPEDWRNWPVVPVPSARAQAIYQRGLELGNDPAHFSKIGDCQSIREVLMGMFDRPGFYELTAEHAYLDETIRAFAGSFNRDGQGVQGGYNAASLLSPLWANPEACQPGENPLACEYRSYRPSIVIISLEVWWDGRTPERYEQYMRRIIEFLIERGSLPVLSTKADNVEGDHAINLATAKLAYEYDLPLWNWWRAAQDLPNGGLDPSRPDGFHLDESAWTARSFTALETLDAVWRGVNNAPAGQNAAVLVTATPAPAAPSVSSVLSTTPAAWPDGLRGTLLLGLIQRQGETEAPLGISAVDLRSGARREIAPAGYRLQAVSADGTLLLASQGSSLWVMGADGSGKMLVNDRLYPAAGAAAWLPGGSAAYIIQDGEGRALVHDRLDGSGWRRISGAADNPLEIYASPADDRVYWGDQEGGAYYATLEGITVGLAESITRPAISPRAGQAEAGLLAFRRVRSEEQSLLVINRLNGAREREAPLPGDMLLDFTWSPDGTRLSALLLNRSEYSGKWLSINHFVFTPADFGTRQLPGRSGLNPRAAWSADGSGLVVVTTQDRDAGDGYVLSAALVDVRNGASVDLTAALGLVFGEFTWVDGLAWVE